MSWCLKCGRYHLFSTCTPPDLEKRARRVRIAMEAARLAEAYVPAQETP